jgi:hypothetical protein
MARPFIGPFFFHFHFCFFSFQNHSFKFILSVILMFLGPNIQIYSKCHFNVFRSKYQF